MRVVAEVSVSCFSLCRERDREACVVIITIDAGMYVRCLLDASGPRSLSREGSSMAFSNVHKR